jgi:hypothetical protein
MPMERQPEPQRKAQRRCLRNLTTTKNQLAHSTNSGSHKRQISSESFNSMLVEKLDMFAAALKDDGPKLPSSAEVLNTLEDVE